MVLFCVECAHGRVDLTQEQQTGQLVGVCDECGVVYSEKEVATLPQEDDSEEGVT